MTHQLFPLSHEPRKRGKFEAKCGCLNHDLFIEGENYKLKTITESVKRHAGFKKLLQRKLINTHKSHICTVCLEKYQQKASIENQNSSNKDADEFDENPICEDILKV